MTLSRFLFCSASNDASRVEPMLEREWKAAESLGATCSLVDHDAIVLEPGTRNGLRRVERAPIPVEAVYRGWMYRPAEYGRFYTGLQDLGLRLVNSPEQYRTAHYLPGWYSLLEGATPRSVWTRGVPSLDEIMQVLAPFGASPVILKDYVKSQKHDWLGSCFIPSAADRSEVKRVLDGFLDWTGNNINEGLVFREFVELEQMGRHPKSGTPLAREMRLWFFKGRLISIVKYWDEISYDGGDVPLSRFEEIGKRIPVPFFTMDVARTKAGDWIVIELGEGQVSGLAETADPVAFYRGLL